MQFNSVGAVALAALLVSAPVRIVTPSAAHESHPAPMPRLVSTPRVIQARLSASALSVPRHAKRSTTAVPTVTDSQRDALFGLMLILASQHGAHSQ